MPDPKRVAAVVTEYRPGSHADVIVGKILTGYRQDGGPGPNLRVVSMVVDQFPAGDMSRNLAQRHRFTIYPTIREALTLGGRNLAVEGVLSIGEHGNYPRNDRGQVLYPRRRFFEEIARVFEQSGRSVPVFNDKHLSATWEGALWMYRRSRQLHIPFLAGSSLPVTWRQPYLQIPLHAPLIGAVQIGYGGLESYGFHALEALQAMVENRRGGESGIRSVQFLGGRAMWQALDREIWSRELFESALSLVPNHAQGNYRDLTRENPEAGVFLLEYRDGFRAAVAMLSGYVQDGGGEGFCFAGQIAGRNQPITTHFFLEGRPPYGHFAHLLRAIDFTMNTGHPAYPIERTLLTTGILDALMRSKHQGGVRIQTPHLDIRYSPSGWQAARGPVPQAGN